MFASRRARRASCARWIEIGQPKGCLFLRPQDAAISSQRGRAVRCPCVPAGDETREGYLFFKKRYPSLRPTQRKFHWQLAARRSAMLADCTALRGGIASLAAIGSAIRFASAPIIRCRSADLVEVQPNPRLMRVLINAASEAMPHSARSLPPCCRHSRPTE